MKPSSTDTVPSAERRKALVVCCAEYAADKYNGLRAPLNDARRLATMLRSSNNGAFDSVAFLPNPVSGALTGALEDLFSRDEASDLLLFYFTGHALLDDDRHLYFATRDTTDEHLLTSSVPAALVHRLLALKAPSQPVVFLLDCCYAGAFSTGLEATIHCCVLGASSAAHQAYEDPTAGGGLTSYFTAALIDGLKGRAGVLRPSSEFIHVDELACYIDDTLSQRSAPQKATTDVNWPGLLPGVGRRPTRAEQESSGITPAFDLPAAVERELKADISLPNEDALVVKLVGQGMALAVVLAVVAAVYADVKSAENKSERLLTYAQPKDNQHSTRSLNVGEAALTFAEATERLPVLWDEYQEASEAIEQARVAIAIGVNFMLRVELSGALSVALARFGEAAARRGVGRAKLEWAARRVRDRDGAIAAFSCARAMLPESEPELRAKAGFGLADAIAAGQHDPERLRVIYRELVHHPPSAAAAWRRLGALAEQRGEWVDGACHYADAARAGGDDEADSWRRAAKHARASGDPHLSVVVNGEAAEALDGERRLPFLARLAQAHVALGDDDAARRAVEEMNSAGSWNRPGERMRYRLKARRTLRRLG